MEEAAKEPEVAAPKAEEEVAVPKPLETAPVVTAAA